MKTIAIVPSAGKGKRLNNITAKPFVKINSKPILAYTLKALDKSPHVNGIILVVTPKLIGKARALIKKYEIRKITSVVGGGSVRGLSVLNGLKALGRDADFVLIHDGVRPFLNNKLIEKAVKSARKYGASCVSVPIKPTIKFAPKGCIKKTLDRTALWEAQTPQVFRKDIILEAYRNRKAAGSATDDSSLVEKTGRRVAIVNGSYRNIKITTKEDLLLAEELLRHRRKLLSK